MLRDSEQARKALGWVRNVKQSVFSLSTSGAQDSSKSIELTRISDYAANRVDPLVTGCIGGNSVAAMKIFGTRVFAVLREPKVLSLPDYQIVSQCLQSVACGV